MDTESLDITIRKTQDRGLQAWHLALALVPGTTFMWVFVWGSCGNFQVTQCTLFDDAMISMAYGRTWASTGELVWYPGADRVQGFTNPLWTAFMAAFHLLGLSGAVAALAVSVFGLVILLGTSCLVGLLVWRGLDGAMPNRAVLACVAAGSTPFLYPLSFWTLRGMEVGALAFLSMLMVASMQRMLSRPARSPRCSPILVMGAASVTGCLIRLDFLAVVAPLVLVAWANLRSPRARQLVIVLVALPTTVAILMVLGGQLLYYGDVLPNTYRLKVEGIDLALRLTRGSLSALKWASLLLVTILAGLVIRRHGTTTARHTSAACVAVILGCVAYCVWAGGDAWEWSRMLNRYLAISLPAVLVVAFLGIGSCIALPPRLSLRAVAVVLVGLGAASFGHALLPDTGDVSFRAWLIEAVASCLIAATLLVALTSPRASAGTRLTATAGLLVGCLVVVSTGVVPILLALQGGPLLVGADLDMTRRVELAKQSLFPGSTVATVWAGAPGYYFEANMIDLLGKSDTEIAAAAPRSGTPFIPGHNKWNYDHSLGTLRPDMIFQLWLTDDADHSKLRSWGYKKRCLKDGSPVYVLMTSMKVRKTELSECPRVMR